MRRPELARYQLQMCSLSSQIGERERSIEAATKAIDLYRAFFAAVAEPENASQIAEDRPERVPVMESIQQCKALSQGIDISQVQEYSSIAEFAVKNWEICQKSHADSLFNATFKNYSIGSLVDLVELEY